MHANTSAYTSTSTYITSIYTNSYTCTCTYTGLTGERTRWSADVGGLELQSTMLVGDCLLGSSFLSYLGAFSTGNDLSSLQLVTQINGFSSL